MKDCPFCFEPVSTEALKCAHCDEYLRCRFCGVEAFDSQRPPRDTAGFGKHLLDRGFLSIEQLMATLDQQLTTRKPIGRVAVDAGLLTRQQVLDVLNAQRDNNRRFGQLAVQKGMLTAAEVDQLLDEQRRTAPRLGELTVELGFLERAVMERELQTFEDALLKPASVTAQSIRRILAR